MLGEGDDQPDYTPIFYSAQHQHQHTISSDANSSSATTNDLNISAGSDTIQYIDSAAGHITSNTDPKSDMQTLDRRANVPDETRQGTVTHFSDTAVNENRAMKKKKVYVGGGDCLVQIPFSIELRRVLAGVDVGNDTLLRRTHRWRAHQRKMDEKKEARLAMKKLRRRKKKRGTEGGWEYLNHAAGEDEGEIGKGRGKEPRRVSEGTSDGDDGNDNADEESGGEGEDDDDDDDDEGEYIRPYRSSTGLSMSCLQCGGYFEEREAVMDMVELDYDIEADLRSARATRQACFDSDNEDEREEERAREEEIEQLAKSAWNTSTTFDAYSFGVKPSLSKRSSLASVPSEGEGDGASLNSGGNDSDVGGGNEDWRVGGALWEEAGVRLSEEMRNVHASNQESQAEISKLRSELDEMNWIIATKKHELMNIGKSRSMFKNRKQDYAYGNDSSDSGARSSSVKKTNDTEHHTTASGGNDRVSRKHTRIKDSNKQRKHGRRKRAGASARKPVYADYSTSKQLLQWHLALGTQIFPSAFAGEDSEVRKLLIEQPGIGEVDEAAKVATSTTITSSSSASSAASPLSSKSKASSAQRGNSKQQKLPMSRHGLFDFDYSVLNANFNPEITPFIPSVCRSDILKRLAKGFSLSLLHDHVFQAEEKRLLAMTGKIQLMSIDAALETVDVPSLRDEQHTSRYDMHIEEWLENTTSDHKALIDRWLSVRAKKREEEDERERLRIQQEREEEEEKKRREAEEQNTELALEKEKELQKQLRRREKEKRARAYKNSTSTGSSYLNLTNVDSPTSGNHYRRDKGKRKPNASKSFNKSSNSSSRANSPSKAHRKIKSMMAR